MISGNQSGFWRPIWAFIMSQFIFQAQPKKKSEEILNKWTTTEPKGTALRTAPLDSLRFLLGLSLKNILAHNKRLEGSSKPTLVATNHGLRQYPGVGYFRIISCEETGAGVGSGTTCGRFLIRGPVVSSGTLMTTKVVPHRGGPVNFRSTLARNGSAMVENQYITYTKLLKIAMRVQP